MSNDFLAVYGVLMRGHGVKRKLGVCEDMTFLMPCVIPGDLYDLGAYPGMVAGQGQVAGELFLVRTPRVWKILDDFENCVPGDRRKSLYSREAVRLLSPDRIAWVYFYNGDVSSSLRIEDGDWTAHLGRRLRKS